MLGHPTDGSQWRKIDRKYKDFAGEARNIRFGLSTYGFNPFGEFSSGHSTWPVTLCMFNLRGWMCMKCRDGNGAGTGRVEHTHARPDMGSG
jgi:hypothetical protein